MIDHELIAGEVEGVRTAFVVPVIPDDAPPWVREALARRRLATITGECPCGARRPKMSRPVRRRFARGEPLRLTVEHEPGCSATAEAELAEWARSAL